mmetsp:Transcript_8840/g.24501  ORF Transcript_8840/g.24501 Transcript_8840/m.24501 type:complete len:229 (-) Transcript_8840:975-1661(-)
MSRRARRTRSCLHKQLPSGSCMRRASRRCTPSGSRRAPTSWTARRRTRARPRDGQAGSGTTRSESRGCPRGCPGSGGSTRSAASWPCCTTATARTGTKPRWTLRCSSRAPSRSKAWSSHTCPGSSGRTERPSSPHISSSSSSTGQWTRASAITPVRRTEWSRRPPCMSGRRRRRVWRTTARATAAPALCGPCSTSRSPRWPRAASAARCSSATRVSPPTARSSPSRRP